VVYSNIFYSNLYAFNHPVSYTHHCSGKVVNGSETSIRALNSVGEIIKIRYVFHFSTVDT